VEELMKILVTGSNGFVGKNLVAELRNKGYQDLLLFDIDSDPNLLDVYTKDCDFVFHLAGVNRPKEEKEFIEGNYGFTSNLLGLLQKHNNLAPILITSSIQAELDNPYGQSKKAGENVVFEYGKITGANVFVYRLPNLFGKWSKPNYNTVVATFCSNIARSIDIQINHPDLVLKLCYIDDLLAEFIGTLEGIPTRDGIFCKVSAEYTITLQKLAETLKNFKNSRSSLSVPDNNNDLEKKLYSTYLSFLPENDFCYDLTMHEDLRGSFTEFIRTSNQGQISVNISKPGITKGNHWHHTKNEKFFVVSGSGVIKFRKVGEERVIEYKVNGDKFQVVDIPTGYTHLITNTGVKDLVTLMWANEPFDSQNPDTYFEEV
jgi:UDP-2-acetamido-2,6-beta-L-arabino-hexul-4-ose reductase